MSNAESSGQRNDDKINENAPKQLCGYLNKFSGHIFQAKGLSITNNLIPSRRRWFVFSGQTCKLYYYKSNRDTEPLGEIDIALATFSYDLESENSGEFTIRSDDKDYILEADSINSRLHWLRNLQNGRREYHERLNFNKYKLSETSISVSYIDVFGYAAYFE